MSREDQFIDEFFQIDGAVLALVGEDADVALVR